MKIRRGVDFNGKWVVLMEYCFVIWGDDGV